MGKFYPGDKNGDGSGDESYNLDEVEEFRLDYRMGGSINGFTFDHMDPVTGQAVYIKSRKAAKPAESDEPQTERDRWTGIPRQQTPPQVRQDRVVTTTRVINTGGGAIEDGGFINIDASKLPAEYELTNEFVGRQTQINYRYYVPYRVPSPQGGGKVTRVKYRGSYVLVPKD